MSDLVSSLPQLAEFPELSISETSCFRQLELQERMSLLPCYLGRLAEGILEHLNGRVLRYCEQYGGVLLCYSKPCVLQRCGRILDEQPQIHFDLKFTACIFKPTIGSILCGTVNKIGGDYIGCLVDDCFNASIVRETQQFKVTNGCLARIELGSKILFRVTKLDVDGGILSLWGEHFDIGSMAEVSLNLYSDVTCGSLQRKKRKSKKREREGDSMAEKPADAPMESADSGEQRMSRVKHKKRKKDKRKRH